MMPHACMKSGWLRPAARVAGKSRRRMRAWRTHDSTPLRGRLGNHDDACVLGESAQSVAVPRGLCHHFRGALEP